MHSTYANGEHCLPALIRALLSAGRYPDSPPAVELVETHASWVLLAGDFAYKIKKPVKLPFLDYSTLEQRRVFCEAELRLNRRFAPELYLAVEAIVGSPENPQIGGQGEPIEFAVKMRRFPEAGRLDRLCARGELQASHVSGLADAVASFHKTAAVAPIDSRFGSPEQVLAPVLENFDELQRLLPEDADLARLDSLRAWTRASYARLAPRLAARKLAGRIRECHGDLHLGNLVLNGGRVTLFDCVEFNEDLRWIDVASEIAFTYIDLLDHGHPGLAGWFVNEWLGCTGDYEAVAVLRFYAVYRALVRAKVAAIRAAQAHDTGLGPVRDYVCLAESLIAPPRPRLIITHGLSGSGKTKASKQFLLRDAGGALLRIRSDVERKRRFGLAISSASGSPLNGGIYAPALTELTYHCLQELAENMLVAGWSVVVDAAFLKQAERTRFRAIANQAGAAFFILAPQATTEQLRERIVARLAKHRDASEATVEVLEMQISAMEELDTLEKESILEFSAED